MDDFYNILMYFIGVCTIIGVAIYISKWAKKRGASIIEGKVIDVIPMYRTVRYKVIILDNGKQIPHSFIRRTYFQSYHVNSRVSYFKIDTPDGCEYQPVVGYYKWAWALIFTPWVSLIFVLLGI